MLKQIGPLSGVKIPALPYLNKKMNEEEIEKLVDKIMAEVNDIPFGVAYLRKELTTLLQKELRNWHKGERDVV